LSKPKPTRVTVPIEEEESFVGMPWKGDHVNNTGDVILINAWKAYAEVNI